MFDWLGGILSGLGDAIGIAFENATSGIVDSIWTALVQWLYTSIYDAIADLFTGINNMGAGIFTLSWVTAVVDLFRLFGWALFAAGVVVAVFDIAIESQSGRVNVKTAALNILKGFFACALVSVVPIELYKFCVSGYLPNIVISTMKGALGSLEHRLANLLFKNTVELAILQHIIAAANDIDERTLREVRGMCVDDVKAINGSLNIDDIVRFQRD